MFQINEVFAPTNNVTYHFGAVRILSVVGFDTIVLIELDPNRLKNPFLFDYAEWVTEINCGRIISVDDPFANVSTIPHKLTPGASTRLAKINKLVECALSDESLLESPISLRRFVKQQAPIVKVSEKTISRWIIIWLKSGKNTTAVVQNVLNQNRENCYREQTSERKRGAKKYGMNDEELPSASAVSETIKKSYGSFVEQRNMSWKSAYHEMLIIHYHVPVSLTTKENSERLNDAKTIQKYGYPSWDQFRYRCRQIKSLQPGMDEVPRGKRGRAYEYAPGPGFFEIDATFFQIQLVSRITKQELVGRPTVYLIADIYDGAVMGYAVSLENPSWATAALALYNCFSNKLPTFKRLGLPFTDKDWPCHHLPNMLRADKAELISNMGQKFPRSGIKVEVTPSMAPIAKGTIEGTNAQVKKDDKGRYDLPGRYAKALQRRQRNGKKQAALDIFEFERILVEIIMDINHSPIPPKRIPPDALSEGPRVATRIGLHEWALEHRAGFTRSMPDNFVFEYLLTQAVGTVTTLGIKVKGEVFASDRLRELGFLSAAVARTYKINVCFNPHLASEIYFFDPERSTWTAAYNTDPEIEKIKASFSETKNLRNLQKTLADEASFISHSRKRERTPFIRQSLKNAAAKKRLDSSKADNSPSGIIENRAEERANVRAMGINAPLKNDSVETSKNIEHEVIPAPNDALSTLALWEKIDDRRS